MYLLFQSMYYSQRTFSTQKTQASRHYTSQGLVVAYQNFPPNIEWYAQISPFLFCSYMTTAQPCDEDGFFLQAPSDSTSLSAPLSQDNWHIHDWSPFEDHLTFDWAYYHYMNLQSSAAEIVEGLNLWSATCIKHSSTVGAPWRNAKEMYATIDSIKTGALPFKTFTFQYTGPKPLTPPRWMEQVYELNTRDVLEVIREQLATPDFNGHIDYIPYKEFNGKGERVWSNLMSGQWAFMQAVCPFCFFFFVGLSLCS